MVFRCAVVLIPLFLIGCAAQSDPQSVPLANDSSTSSDDVTETEPDVLLGEVVFLEPDFIPTVSQWGLVIMTLLLLTGMKLKFGRRLPRQA